MRLGGRVVDTAPVYGGGESEQVVGNWLWGRGRRDDVVVFTKCCHPLADGQPRVTPQAVRDDLTRSLERLGTDYVDMLMLHRDDETVPVGPLMEELHQRVSSGTVRAVGVSNWRAPRVAEANAYAERNGLTRLLMVSNYFSLCAAPPAPWPGFVDGRGAEFQHWLTAHQFPLLAWGALSKGFFAYDSPCTPGTLGHRWFANPDNDERRQRAHVLARATGRTPEEIVLAWVLQRDFPVLAIFRTSKVPHLRSAWGALMLTLTPQQTRWLDLDAEAPGPGASPV